MIGEALYHDTTPTRGAHDGRCVKPQQQQPDMPLTQQQQPDMPLTQDMLRSGLIGVCSSRTNLRRSAGRLLWRSGLALRLAPC